MEGVFINRKQVGRGFIEGIKKSSWASFKTVPFHGNIPLRSGSLKNDLSPILKVSSICNEENLRMSSSGLFLLLMNQKAQSCYFLSYPGPRWRKQYCRDRQAGMRSFYGHYFYQIILEIKISWGEMYSKLKCFKNKTRIKKMESVEFI